MKIKVNQLEDTNKQGVAFLIKTNTKFTNLQLNTNYQAIAENIQQKVHICNIVYTKRAENTAR